MDRIHRSIRLSLEEPTGDLYDDAFRLKESILRHISEFDWDLNLRLILDVKFLPHCTRRYYMRRIYIQDGGIEQLVFDVVKLLEKEENRKRFKFLAFKKGMIYISGIKPSTGQYHPSFSCV